MKLCNAIYIIVYNKFILFVAQFRARNATIRTIRAMNNINS